MGEGVGGTVGAGGDKGVGETGAGDGPTTVGGRDTVVGDPVTVGIDEPGATVGGTGPQLTRSISTASGAMNRYRDVKGMCDIAMLS